MHIMCNIGEFVKRAARRAEYGLTKKERVPRPL